MIPVLSEYSCLMKADCAKAINRPQGQGFLLRFRVAAAACRMLPCHRNGFPRQTRIPYNARACGITSLR